MFWDFLLIGFSNCNVIMTDGYYYYQGFMSALQYRISNKAVLVNTIADILAIDKDAVYRRLRGDVNFSFIEMATIAKKLGISLDSIVEIESVQSKPAQVIMTKHINPTELDYRMFNDHVNLLKFIKDEPNTKIIESGNIFPHYIYYDYEHFTKFYMFCWSQASISGTAIPYHKIIIPEQMRILQKNCCLFARHIKSTQYIWDHMIFQRLVENINFFAKVRFINEEDISLIKNDLIDLLDNIEKVTATGKHEDTGNKISIYISDINIETNYSCIESKNLHISLFRSFLLNTNSALDEQVFAEMKSWMQYMQRMSTLISVSGEKFRAEYFDKQREIILTL